MQNWPNTVPVFLSPVSPRAQRLIFACLFNSIGRYIYTHLNLYACLCKSVRSDCPFPEKLIVAPFCVCVDGVVWLVGWLDTIAAYMYLEHYQIIIYAFWATIKEPTTTNRDYQCTRVCVCVSFCLCFADFSLIFRCMVISFALNSIAFTLAHTHLRHLSSLCYLSICGDLVCIEFVSDSFRVPFHIYNTVFGVCSMCMFAK